MNDETLNSGHLQGSCPCAAAHASGMTRAAMTVSRVDSNLDVLRTMVILDITNRRSED